MARSAAYNFYCPHSKFFSFKMATFWTLVFSKFFFVSPKILLQSDKEAQNFVTIMEDQQNYEDNFTSEDQTYGDYGTDFNEGQQSSQANGDVESQGGSGDAAQSSKSSSEEDK